MATKTARVLLLILGFGVAACASREPPHSGEPPQPSEPRRSGDCYHFERTVDELGTVLAGTACREPDGTWRIQPPG